MGAALTYARRYALFALVGIAGEDDIDAPEPFIVPTSTNGSAERNSAHDSAKAMPAKIRGAVLEPQSSAQLREELVREIEDLKNADELATWAYRRFAAKNTLTESDAREVESAYKALLDKSLDQSLRDATAALLAAGPSDKSEAVSEVIHGEAVTTPLERSRIAKPVRRRNKAHRIFVASHPCLICQRTPCDAHHIKFAQPKAMGRKVSDEYTVPLCRDHHRQLHSHGDEQSWWGNMQVAPLEVAAALWRSSPIHRNPPDISRTSS
jgi:hypothetical protein